MKNLYLNIYCLRPILPSCLNRDDTGSVKTASIEGATRQRISSQCIKRAVRNYMREYFSIETGIRTRKIVGCIFDEIINTNPEKWQSDEEQDILKQDIALILSKAGVIPEVKGKKTKDGKEAPEPASTDPDQKEVMAYFSIDQIKAVANWISEQMDDPDFKTKLAKKPKKIGEEICDVLNPFATIDQLMFGRMFAGNPKLNYDASVQVAHAISVHKANIEYDYFAAVDDLAEQGAGHISGLEYTNSLIYCYADINLRELYENVKKYMYVQEEDAEKVFVNAVVSFVKAFIKANPSGKQNAFASHEVAYETYISISGTSPYNAGGAFEHLITTAGDGYQKNAAKALADRLLQIYDDDGEPDFGCNIILAPDPEHDPMRCLGTSIKTKELDEVLGGYLKTQIS